MNYQKLGFKSGSRLYPERNSKESELNMINYSELGFKSGLEIHAQLDVGKLFCSCPSVLRQDKPDFVVKRELRPLAGETGEIDIAAAYEKAKQLYYIYEGYNNTTCLVELDEEPPHLINQEALKVALTIAKALNCTFPDTIQIMRKTVVDGSNTSGFQRTALIGMNGWLKTSFGKVGINFITLEEDAARRVREDKKSVTFRLDRLGIPLLEIVTAPDMNIPDHVAEVAKKIGELIKSTGKAMRGIGTIRQDINISVRGHCRVELKGVQDLRLMRKYIDAEILRQQKSKKETQHVRNVKPDFCSKYLRPLPTAARMYPETDLPLIKITKQMIDFLKLPEALEMKMKRYLGLGLSKDLAEQIIKSEQSALFEQFVGSYKGKISPTIIASTMTSTAKEVKRKLGLEEFEPDAQLLDRIFLGLAGGDKYTPRLVKESILDIFLGIASGRDIYEILNKYKVLSDAELKEEIEKLKKEFLGAPEHKLTGIIIGKLRGRAEPKKIIKFLRKRV